jgi:hypothetical protein
MLLETNIDMDEIDSHVMPLVRDREAHWRKGFKEMKRTSLMYESMCRFDDETDDGTEVTYRVLLRDIIASIVPLVVMIILQLWVTDRTVPPSWERILTITSSLRYREERPDRDEEGSLFMPDFSVKGFDPSDPEGPKLCISNLDAKNSSIAGKQYGKDGSKDGYISLLVSNGHQFATSMQGLRKDSWQAHTHHLLAQVFLKLWIPLVCTY